MSSHVANKVMNDPACLVAERGARLLVVAPHPDDESIATAGLLIRAQAAGAAVQLLFLTDGERNPWTQRWLERRSHVGESGRVRWGERRRSEAHAAAAVIGLPDSVLTCLGWPDLGVTDRLMRATEASVKSLATIIDSFKPTVMVFPALSDSHPDHGASHVLARLALARPGMPEPGCLTYHVHGKMPDSEPIELHLSAREVERKRRAILAHESQMALGGGHWLREVGSVETYWPVAAGERDAEVTDMGLTLPWKLPRILRPACELLLVVGEFASSRTRPPPIHGVIVPECDTHVPVFAKLRQRWRSPWIFDRWGWRCLRAERLTDSMDSAKLIDDNPVPDQ